MRITSYATTAILVASLVPSLGNAQPGAHPPASPPGQPPPPNDAPAPPPAYQQPPPPPAYQQPPPPPAYRPPPPIARPQRLGHYRRSGLAIGFGVGIGGMDSENDLFVCSGCDPNDAMVAGSFDFHVGGMINPRLALLFELWSTAGILDSFGDVYLLQTMAMFAAQFWVMPRLWLKGGIGVSHLSLNYDDGFVSDVADLDSGLGVMAAVGYEVMAARSFTMDLQLRLGGGFYDGLGGDGDTVSAATFGLGFNWY